VISKTPKLKKAKMGTVATVDSIPPTKEKKVKVAKTETVEKVTKKSRSVDLDKLTQSLKASCGVYLPISKCESLIINEVLDPRIYPLIKNLEECRQEKARTEGETVEYTYDFSRLSEDSKKAIQSAYVEFQTEQKETFEKEKLKAWEASKAEKDRLRIKKFQSNFRPELRLSENRAELETLLLSLDGNFYSDFKETIEVRNADKTAVYSSLAGMTDSDKYSFFRRLVKSNKTRVSEVSKAELTMFTDKVVKSLVFLSIVQCLLSDKKMLNTSHAVSKFPMDFTELRRQFVEYVAKLNPDVDQAGLVTLFDNSIRLFPIVSNLRSYQLSIHQSITEKAQETRGPKKQKRDVEQETTESTTEEDVNELHPGELHPGELHSGLRQDDEQTEKKYPFSSYINKIVDVVKLELSGFVPTEGATASPFSLNIRTPFKQLCSEVVTEVLIKLGNLLKVEIQSRNVKTVNQRVVLTAISAFIILSNLDPIRDAVITELDTQYDEYKVKREEFKSSKENVEV